MQIEFTHVIEALPGLVWTALPDGRAEFLNQRWSQYTGISLDRMIGLGWQSVIHPDDLATFAEKWEPLGDAPAGQMCEVRLRRSDGVFRWFSFRREPLRDGKGSVTRWCGTGIDIDDARQRETLHAAEKRAVEMVVDGASLREVLDQLCSSIEVQVAPSVTTVLVMDADGKRLWQGGGQRVPHEWISKIIPVPVAFEAGLCGTAAFLKERVVVPDVATEPNWPDQYRDLAIRSGIRAAWSEPILTKDNEVLGTFALYSHEARAPGEEDLALIKGGGHIARIAIERQRLREALTTARSELAHVTRVTTLNALTVSIAHEVNQPLSGIITNASTCLRMLNADPPNLDGARETVLRTIRDGNRAADVIARLRALFSKKGLTPEPLDLNEATREVIALSLGDLQRNRVVLRSELADGLALIEGDRVQVQQVILNLIRNASDAMVGVDDRPRALVIKTEHGGDDQVRLSVIDAGVGFDREAADKLFEAFYTTKDDGMGIGLSVSRSIIERHHGRLWAAPNEGAPGATVSFSIPRKREGAQPQCSR